MTISDNEMQLEKKYLEVVTKELRDKISSIGSNLYEAEEKVNEFKKYMWDNKAGMDRVEVSAAILENDLEVELLTLRGHYLKKLMRCENSPYFGILIMKKFILELPTLIKIMNT